MYHSCGALNLLTAGDAAFLFLAGSGSQVVVKSINMSGSSRLTDDCGTLTIVFLDYLLVVVKVEIFARQCLWQQLKPMSSQ